MTYRQWARIALGYLALVSITIGLWAQFAPRSFYDQFPGLGRAWVRVDGPYNEHLVRDVGGLNLALAVVIVAAMISLTRPLVVAAAAATLATGIPHLAYHIVNANLLSAGDAAMSIGGLALFAVLPVALIVVSREPSRLAAG
jgi:hypothetical protein